MEGGEEMNRFLPVQIFGFLIFFGAFILFDIVYQVVLFGPSSIVSAADIIASLPFEHQFIHIVVPLLIGIFAAWKFNSILKIKESPP